MATEESEISLDDELNDKQKKAIMNLVSEDGDLQTSKRDFMQLAGGGVMGALLGYSGNEIAQPAKADADPNDGDGNVGQEGDPVDAWIEGLAGPTGSPIDLGSDIVPDTDASYDLGSSTASFNNAYMSNLESESINSTIRWVSPGDDLQSRVDATPSGGILAFEVGEHDIATMGTATISDPITVTMSGGHIGNQASPEPTGAYILNEGADGVDSPVFTVDNATAGDNETRPYGVEFVQPVAKHDAAAPFIDVVESPQVNIKSPFIDLVDAGQAAVKMSGSQGQSWGIQIEGGRITRVAGSGYGIEDRTPGALNYIRGTQIMSGQNGSVGMRANGGWYIDRTDFATDDGIHVTGGNCVIRSRHENSGRGVVIGPSSDVSSRVPNVKLMHTWTSHMSGVPVVFDYAKDCMLTDPLDLPTDAAYNARWTGNSLRCSLLGRGQLIQNGSWDFQSGAVKPEVDFIGTEYVGDALRDLINQPTPGMTIYNPNDGNLNIYNGSNWILPDGSTT